MNKKKIYQFMTSVLLLTTILGTYIYYATIIQYNYNTQPDNRIVIEIQEGFDIDDVIRTLSEKGDLSNIWSFKLLSIVKKYNNNIKFGKFELNGRYKNNDLINVLRVRKREIIKLQIPENIRTIDRMIVLLEDSIGIQDSTIQNYLDTSTFLSDNNLTFETLPAFFIPNTYEIYKDISMPSFFNRMKQEYNNFWNEDRSNKCDSLGLSKIEVAILASIVEEEQDKRLDERPMIAGLYLNRLNNPSQFPFLQADPTVKFANKDFSIKQILNKHLAIDNPYNTYKYKGLPPGPICIPSINAIESVLNASEHDYYFMCAGSNGDGYHKFTSTNKEHNKNKRRYKEYQNFN